MLMTPEFGDILAPTAETAHCLEAVSHLNQCGYVIWEAGRVEAHVSDIGRRLLGLPTTGGVKYLALIAMIDAADRAALMLRWQQAIDAHAPHQSAEFSATLADGSSRHLRAYVLWTYGDGGMLQSCVVALVDITSQHEMLTALTESEARLEEAQRIACLGYWEWDFERQSAMISESARTMLHCASDWTPDRRALIELVPTDQRDWVMSLYKDAYKVQQTHLRYEVRHVDADGSLRDIHTMVKIDYGADGRARRLLATIQDISELRTYRRQLHHLSFFDPVTQLPNRALFVDRLGQALTDAAWSQRQVGVIMLDLDRFKDINDSMGHSAGDSLLKQVAERLQHVLREYDTVARLGGDEFAVVLPGVRHASDLGSVAQKVLSAFAKPFEVGEQKLFMTTSVGGALYPNDAKDVDELLQYADAALYHAKNKGRNNFQFYAKELTDQAQERLSMEGELRRALECGELELHYQPKFDLQSGALLGAEALMRWNHPQRGMVPPLSFIPMAEDTGLIVPMGSWALKEACATVTRWNTGRAVPLKMAVNLSARQFASSDFQATVCDTLGETDCQPAWLELEITESLLLEGRPEVRALLEDLSTMGISIAIDDFGTGYSALSYLTRFPVDTLKIDRAFVKGLPGDRSNGELVKAIISLGHSLGMVIVAEGVETSEQGDALRLLGCEMVQGYLFGKPMSSSAFDALLAKHSTAE